MKQVYALVFPMKYGAPLEIIKVEDFFERWFSLEMNSEAPVSITLKEEYYNEPIFSTDKEFLIESAKDYIECVEEQGKGLLEKAKITKIKICEDD